MKLVEGHPFYLAAGRPWQVAHNMDLTQQIKLCFEICLGHTGHLDLQHLDTLPLVTHEALGYASRLPMLRL